jgi:hypothetical protein
MLWKGRRLESSGADASFEHTDSLHCSNDEDIVKIELLDKSQPLQPEHLHDLPTQSILSSPSSSIMRSVLSTELQKLGPLWTDDLAEDLKCLHERSNAADEMSAATGMSIYAASFVVCYRLCSSVRRSSVLPAWQVH